MKDSIKYNLYERSVQSPKADAELYDGFYRLVKKRPARHLREDFCGTFALSTEWVKMNKKNTAVGLDLDPRPIAFGMTNHYDRLNSHQKSRLKILQKNVVSKTTPKHDLVIANNFSFYIFHDLALLVNYFKKARTSLNNNGVFFLEMVGGSGFIECLEETRKFRKSGKPWLTYYWDQQTFDPITRTGRWAIHFKLAGHKKEKNVFTYYWRLWTIPEVRFALSLAGFKKSLVLWDMPKRGGRGSEFKIVEKGINEEAWISYIAAVP